MIDAAPTNGQRLRVIDHDAAERVAIQGEGAHESGPPPGPAKEASPGVSVLDAAAIWAPLPKLVDVAEGFLRAGSLAEIIAFGASGKSWVGVELVVAVATATPAFGRFPTSKGSTLYLDWEAGAYEMRRRFQAVSRARDLDGPVEGVSLACMPALYLTQRDFERRLFPLCEGRAVVVFDTLRAASPGVDENDSRMREGLDRVHRVLERTGCAGVFLAHAKKTSGILGGVDPREAGRGSSAIFDAADSVFHVLYRKGEPMRVEQTKSRVGKATPPFLVRIEDTPNGGVRVLASDAGNEHDTPSQAFEDLCDRVLEVVKDDPGASGRVVRARVSGKATFVLAALERLEKHGAVRNTGTERAARWFPTNVGAAQ